MAKQPKATTPKPTATRPRASADVPEVAGLAVGEVAPERFDEWVDLDLDGLQAVAEQALAEYDYERALHALRLGVRRSRGTGSALGALGAFLVETYAAYDEAIALLTSPLVNVEREPALRWLLAQALFHGGRQAEAEPHLAAVTRPGAEPRRWAMLAAAREALGNLAGAVEAYAEAERLAPTDREVRERRQAAAARLLQDSAAPLAEARAALTAGELLRARDIVDGLRPRLAAEREFLRLQGELETAELAARAERARQAATVAEAEGRAEAALDEAREWLRLAPSDEAARTAVQRLETLIATTRVQDLLERGAAAFVAGDRGEAVALFYRAQTLPGGAAVPAELPGRALFDAVAEFVAEVGPRQIERAREGLPLLLDGEALLSGNGDPTGAEDLCRRALPLLKGFRRADALQEALLARRLAAERERARPLYDEARAAEAQGDRIGAAEGYRRALAVAGGAFADAADRLAAIERDNERDAERSRALIELDDLSAADRPFAVLRTAEALPPGLQADPDVQALRVRATEAIRSRFSVQHLPPLPGPGAAGGPDAYCGLNSRDAGLPKVDHGRLRTLSTPTGASLFLVNGDDFVAIDTAALAVRVVARVPAEVTLGRPEDTLLVAEADDGAVRFVLVQTAEQALYVLDFVGNRLTVRDRLSLRGLLPGAPQNGVRQYRLHGASGRLIVLEAGRGCAGPSQWYSVDLDEARVANRAEFSFGLNHLQNFPGTPWLSANRVLDCHPLSPGYFAFALFDAKGRIQRRVAFGPQDLEEVMEGIRSLSFSARLGRTFVLFRYYHPLTGEVAQTAPAMLVLKDDFSVFYSNANPATLLAHGHQALGWLRVQEDETGARVVLPHRTSEGEIGLTVLDASDLRRQFEVALPLGESLQALHSTRSGRDLVVLTLEPEGHFHIRRLDMQNRALGI